MAQQIVIDIVAETKKLTEGLNKTNDGISDIQKNLKTATKTAVAFASAFVLKKGVEWLKEGVDGVYDAQKAMKAATSAFGEGSDALKKITEQADKFGKEIAMDNDDIIKLATSIGVKLPKDAQGASAELVLLAKNLEATSGGSIAAEATLAKLGKAFADGEISAKELAKTVPGLDASTYKMAETLSKAGKNQEALNVLIEAGEKKYGGAAASQVTASQKLEVALDDLKESIATGVVPIIEKLTGFLVTMIEQFKELPKPIQDLSLGLLAIVGVGGPLLSFVANMKSALTTLGFFTTATEGATVATNLMSLAMKAIPILAVIALIALLIANWDDVSDAAKKVWEAISKWWGKVYDDIKEFAGKAIKWLEDNWPKILAVLTGPFGLFALWIVTHKDDVLKKFSELWDAVKTAILDKVESIKTGITDKWNAIKDAIGEKIDAIKTSVSDKWNAIKDAIVGENGILVKLATSLAYLWGEIGTLVTGAVESIKTGVTNTWNSLKTKTSEIFTGIQTKASEIWTNIKDYIIGVVTNVVSKFSTVKQAMIDVGKDIANGIMQGLMSMTFSFGNFLRNWINTNIPSAVRKILGISSPSKVMAEIGKYTIEGLYQGMGIKGPVGIQMPQINVGGAGGVAPINITINAGAGTDAYALGRTVTNAVSKYARVSAKTGQYTQL